jgi:hypothetical protein
VGERRVVVGVLVDVKEQRAGNVLGKVAGTCVDGRVCAYGWKRGVEDDGVGIVQAGGEPDGFDEEVQSSRLLGQEDSQRILSLAVETEGAALEPCLTLSK